MATGQKPDYRVMLPVNSGRGKDAKTVWHRHGAAWRRDNGTIGIVLDVGAAVTFEAGTQLVLVEETDDGRQPGED